MLRHDMLVRCAYSSAVSRAYEDGRRIFTALPMYHVCAYVEGLLAASFMGGTLLTMPEFVPNQALRMLSEHEATNILRVPPMLVALLNHPDRDAHDYSSLVALTCAAAPIPVWRQAVEAFGVSEIRTGYGGTEVTAASVPTEVGDPMELVARRVRRIKPGGSSGPSEFAGANNQYKVLVPHRARSWRRALSLRWRSRATS
ncbi:MAG TPA: AMP-binding protein [Trueperaceae bacterium]